MGARSKKCEILTVVAEQEMHAVGVGQDDDGVGLDCSLGLQRRNKTDDIINYRF